MSEHFRSACLALARHRDDTKAAAGQAERTWAEPDRLAVRLQLLHGSATVRGRHSDAGISFLN